MVPKTSRYPVTCRHVLTCGGGGGGGGGGFHKAATLYVIVTYDAVKMNDAFAVIGEDSNEE